LRRTSGQVKYQIVVAENNWLLCKFVITLSQCKSLS